MTVDLARVEGHTPDSFRLEGQAVDRLYLGGELIYSTVDVPRITSFVLAPAYGVQGANGVINAAWDIDGDVASTALERRRHGSADAWTAEGISAQTGTDSDPLPWQSTDQDYRLTVTNALGESDTAVRTFYRTLAPVIDRWTFHSFRQVRNISTWFFELEARCWPKPVVSISGSVAGAIHVAQQRVQRTSADNGWTFDAQHSTGQPDYAQVWTVTVANPTTGETASDTLTLAGG